MNSTISTLCFNNEEIPHKNTSVSSATRSKDYRKGDKGKEWARQKYLARPFVAYDGEGITDEFDGIHRYVMLASKNAITMTYDAIVNREGLSTYECLEFLLEHRLPKGIHIIFGGSYDINMLLRDLSENDLRTLYKYGKLKWQGMYHLEWRRGKSLWIKRIWDKVSITLYDVLPFFQTSFVNACDSFLGKDFFHREAIIANKALRSSFKEEDIPVISSYNSDELTNLIMLAETLRERLDKVDLRPTRWDGPGAIAAALLKRENIKDAESECPDDIARAGRYAYAGGRFEVLKFGHVNKPAYEYDINSAYPAALRNVPNLARGYWKRSMVPETIFSVVRIKFTADNWEIPGPLFRRNPKGTICYPVSGIGWYWKPEYDAAILYQQAGYGSIEVLDCWEFVPYTDEKPFAFIEPMYELRKALKAAGDGAEKALKLGYNSIYGKLCQQVGAYYDNDTKEWVKPPYHQLEWAGYTTSYCRAKVLTAALQDMDSIIAFETDALFSSRPLNLPISDNLGDWEMTVFTSLTYLQSGMYYGTLAKPKWNDRTKRYEDKVVKTRGVDRCNCDGKHDPSVCGGLTKETVLDYLSNRLAKERYAPAKLSRFIGAGLALMQGIDKWRTWDRMTKSVSLEPMGKRIHHPHCPNDNKRNKSKPFITFNKWHLTVCPFMDDGESCEYPLLWLNPNPNMDMIEELRELDTEMDVQL
jgi:hypothetical protein